MVYGYARVSTKEQNTARQLEAFKAERGDSRERPAPSPHFINPKRRCT